MLFGIKSNRNKELRLQKQEVKFEVGAVNRGVRKERVKLVLDQIGHLYGKEVVLYLDQKLERWK